MAIWGFGLNVAESTAYLFIMRMLGECEFAPLAIMVEGWSFSVFLSGFFVCEGKYCESSKRFYRMIMGLLFFSWTELH